MAGIRNSTLFGDNVDFSGATIASPQVTTNGQLLIGSTVAPNIRVGNLIAGTGMSIVNGAGTITLNSNGGGLTWSLISSSQNLAKHNGYMVTSGALSLALPATASSTVGDLIEVVLTGGTSWTITQDTGQQIKIGNQSTTLTTGTVASAADGDWIQLVYQESGLWRANVKQGNLTIV